MIKKNLKFICTTFFLISYSLSIYSFNLQEQFGAGIQLTASGMVVVDDPDLFRSVYEKTHKIDFKDIGMGRFTNFEDQQQSYNKLAKEFIDSQDLLLVLNPIPDLSKEKCHLKKESQGCEKASYGGMYINIQGCSRREVARRINGCKPPSGYEIKSNGGLGKIGDGYKAQKKEINSTKLTERCEIVTDSYAICNGERYDKTRSQVDSLNRNIHKVFRDSEQGHQVPSRGTKAHKQ